MAGPAIGPVIRPVTMPVTNHASDRDDSMTSSNATFDADAVSPAESGHRNPQASLTGIGLEPATVHWNLGAHALYEHAIRRGEGRIAAGGALVVRDRPAHRPLGPGQVHRPRRRRPADTVWWDNNKPMIRRTVRRSFLPTCSITPVAARSVRPGPVRRRRRRKTASPSRVITELAWHTLFIRNLLIRPDAEGAGRLRAGVHDHRSAELPRRSRAPRLPHRDGDRGRFYRAGSS